MNMMSRVWGGGGLGSILKKFFFRGPPNEDYLGGIRQYSNLLL